MKVNVYRFFLHDIVFLHIVTKLKSSNLYNYLYQYLSGFNTHYTMVHFTSSIYSTRDGVAQWLGRRISDQGVPGSNPGRCTFFCGLEQVTFTLLSTG